MNSTTTRLWIGLFVMLVFVCGLSAGFAVSARLGPGSDPGGFRRGSFPPGGGRGGPSAFVSQRIIERLESDPDFTDDRRERLEALFAEREERFREFNREMRQRFLIERARLRQDMATILTPGQMEILDAARREGRRGWNGPGG